MRLNLGCGDRYVAGWTNVDHGYPGRVDERVDLTGELPAAWTDVVTHVYAGHLLEHVTYEAALALTTRLVPCAHPDGCLLVAVGPDVEVAEKMVADGTFDATYHSLDSIREGGRRWPGDEHRWWRTTGVAVADLLRRAGWPVVAGVSVTELDDTWPVADRTPPWQYAVRAWVGERRKWR